jgi:hypothetical protein
MPDCLASAENFSYGRGHHRNAPDDMNRWYRDDTTVILRRSSRRQKWWNWNIFAIPSPRHRPPIAICCLLLNALAETAAIILRWTCIDQKGSPVSPPQTKRSIPRAAWLPIGLSAAVKGFHIDKGSQSPSWVPLLPMFPPKSSNFHSTYTLTKRNRTDLTEPEINPPGA